jgi:DNA-binding transcriptional regulator GbsR (MarR family)
LLLASGKPLSTDEVMEQLEISRGNANMNLRALIDWGIVKRIHKRRPERIFYSRKRCLVSFQTDHKERRKREIEPVISFWKN